MPPPGFFAESFGPDSHPLLLERPGMKGGAPLATLVQQHICPMTANFLTSGVGFPPAIGVAKVAFLLAALHRYLMALEPPLIKLPNSVSTPSCPVTCWARQEE